jgi:hypothetical protein
LHYPSDILDEIARLDREGTCHFHHLDEVETTLPSLVLRHEGLRTAKQPRKFNLGELTRAPRGSEGLAQPHLGGTEERSGHRRGHITPGNLDPLWVIPSSVTLPARRTSLACRRAAVAKRRRSWRRDALAAWAVYMLLGLYLVVDGYTNQNADGQWGILALAIGALPAIGLMGYTYVSRRMSRPTAHRPTGPIAASREPIPAGLRFAVLRRDGFRCAYCGQGEPEGVQLHIDHIVPVARGGRTELENLVTACATCNIGKSASDLVGS